MGDLSSAGEAAALVAILTSAALSLHTADPGDDGSNEVSGGSYARKNLGTFTDSGSNPTSASNDNAIMWDAATTDWGTVTHVGVWVSGTFYGGKAVATPKLIETGDVASFPATAFIGQAD